MNYQSKKRKGCRCRVWLRSFFLPLFLYSISGVLPEAAGQSKVPSPTRTAFLQMLDRPRVPLAPEVKVLPALSGLEYEHFTFSSEQGQRVPGLLLKQSGNGRRPVVVVMSGTGGTKEGQLEVLKALARLGFVAVSIDGRHHGERQNSTGSAQYVAAMLETYRTGRERPFLYDTVWDLMRLVDYLETRSDVHSDRIGLTGFSKGGMETYLTAAADLRIAVAVPMIGVQSFAWALDHDMWMSRVGTFQKAVDKAAREAGVEKVDAVFVRAFYDRVAPGIYTHFDGPAMLPLIAPRPLMVINGDSDDRTPLPGLINCSNLTEEAYRKAKATEKYKLYLQKDTGHTVRPEALQVAIDWFVSWLKP
jgi:dienelactone hydrolase